MSCPICGEQTAQRWRPFCSRRCADLDLARWLNGSYTLEPVEPGPDELPDNSPDPDPSRRH
ncbi:hypothetical protein SAMN05444007_11344 [Cribrihabitans marinus]|uniref:DNA gyrase inhibitor YacG n=1 Tax=Cribrihabitans marinus TaxID=1227549 RepID=A0A1H7DUH3_9RHOB|nr:DNA gyrase inhibitor YacG [Cribrihabitans marinus]GGH39899.1 hypothetical protein GCM10010973_36000 [Cribrihabitans marinus]SEK04497.1 hypothetical protein SAMN05444007_11344 [Cribrihabitans marinus]